ncbi:hypothetical protein OHD62_29060 [Mesorhizobium sp. YC-39]|uniref:hypothetical protein n=1 Tax=unclassified Mesorhizobium TaxID=325217 RepID=UPI0021E75266|nr:MULTISPECIES: hypothetical protein [unclassified Mesorhizobium]MCV3210659.1 hypothetical protein [Mesorhizobium sp. YC-2]MCV3232443.1 hypothetical protein [Mesorhizobium sp. YC-39]
MKTASTFLQILALSACFAAQVHGTFAMPGVRQALRTMDGANSQSMPPTATPLEIAQNALN